MNTNYILIGLVSIVALVAITAMAQQGSISFDNKNMAGLPTFPSVEYDFVPQVLFERTDGNVYVTNAQGTVLGHTTSRQHTEQSFDIYMHQPRFTNVAGLSHATPQAKINLLEDEKGTRYGVLKQGQSYWVVPLVLADESVSFDYYPYWYGNAPAGQNRAGLGATSGQSRQSSDENTPPFWIVK